VIPLLGLASAAVALALGRSPIDIAALALLGAALAAAIRAFGGPTLATAITAGAGAALGVLGVLDIADTRGMLGGAAGMFAICELARAKAPGASPWPAIGAAVVAGVFDPVYVALVPVAGVALVVDPASRPRWVLAVPALGLLATALAIIASTTHVFASLWIDWAGHAHTNARVADVLARAGDILGPLAATAALAGLAVTATRSRFAASGVLGVAALITVDMVSSNTVAPALPIVSALGAGVAIGRLAALVRAPVGQTFVGATAGFVLVAVPVWTLLY
jgi:hypothetical protein